MTGPTLPDARRSGPPLERILAFAFAAVCAAWISARGLAMAGRMADAAWAPVFSGLDDILGLVCPVACIAAVFIWRPSRPAGASPTAPTFALAWVLAATFLMFDLGKALHTAEMIAFFQTSGWPGWLHWVVMAIEVSTALILLLAPLSRIAALSSAALFLVMIGAVLTHARNGDPLLASFDAVRQMVMLACFQGLHPSGWLRGGWRIESRNRTG
ncbi:DoxX family protein [Caulobacter sp. UNC358MFTsu5.1]|uniref:DoxX family protein n=1 Tax=Caulobacter sp. UNC358MFTsu5.1 TaxID=1449049 RepID=UPI0004A6F5F6|nr:DoxX family protein [Caulobacter sp. UNC358MFTsu5.1]